MSLVLCVDNAAEFMAAVDQFAATVIEGTRAVVQETCDEGAAHGRAVGAFQDRTGALRRSIVGRVVRRDQHGTSGVIEATAPHAVFVEDDTRPHEIRPKAGEGSYGPLRRGQSRRASGDIGTSRKSLRWTEGGEVHFARVVQHPGTRGKPFMGPAAIKAEAALHAKADLLTARAIARFQRA